MLMTADIMIIQRIGLIIMFIIFLFSTFFGFHVILILMISGLLVFLFLVLFKMFLFRFMFAFALGLLIKEMRYFIDLIFMFFF